MARRPALRESFRELGSRIWLLEVALGVAIAVAAVEFAASIGSTVVNLITTRAPASGGFNPFPSLTLEIGGHVLYLADLLSSGIALVVVLAVALLVIRRMPPAEKPHTE